MNGDLSQLIEMLVSELAELSVSEQQEFHLALTSELLLTATLAEVSEIREDPRMAQVCEWLGHEHRLAFFEVIEGHLALRQMGLIRARRRVAG